MPVISYPPPTRHLSLWPKNRDGPPLIAAKKYLVASTDLVHLELDVCMKHLKKKCSGMLVYEWIFISPSRIKAT